MNPQIDELDVLWKQTRDALCAQMEAERGCIQEIANGAGAVRTIDHKIDAAENDLVQSNTGKELPINGSNAETRKAQSVVLLASRRETDLTLCQLYAELAQSKSTLTSAELRRESTKDAIEISRLTLAHIDAVLRALATP